jgi:hypothetical protein
MNLIGMAKDHRDMISDSTSLPYMYFVSLSGVLHAGHKEELRLMAMTKMAE